MGQRWWRCAVLACGALLAGCSGGSTGAVHSATPRTTTPQTTTTAPALPGARSVIGTYVVVTGNVPRRRLRSTLQEADKAAKWVTLTWGDVWHARTTPVQIYVPRSASEFLSLGGGGSEGDQVSATTTSAGAVVLSPALTTKVTSEGRIVVLAHELTHVALHQATLSQTPKWVIEGSAELTAYRPTGLTLAEAAPQLAAQVHAGEPPVGPPEDGEFSSKRADLQIAYQRAYAWCLFLSQRYGLPAFTAFVRQADKGGSDAAFRTQFHTTASALTDAYRSWLRTRLP